MRAELFCLGVALQFLPYRVSDGGRGRAGWLASALSDESVHHEHGESDIDH